jgi:hypothetical protein
LAAGAARSGGTSKSRGSVGRNGAKFKRIPSRARHAGAALRASAVLPGSASALSAAAVQRCLGGASGFHGDQCRTGLGGGLHAAADQIGASLFSDPP